MLSWTAFAKETYLNGEAIAINQAKGNAGIRMLGSDMQFPCGEPDHLELAVQPCEQTAIQWFSFDQGFLRWSGANGSMVLDAFDCGTADGTVVKLYPQHPAHAPGVPCQGRNQLWSMTSNGSIINLQAEKCLTQTASPTGALVLSSCNGSPSQNWTLDQSHQLHSADGGCVTVKATPTCTNVWGRLLADGSVGLVVINNFANTTTVTCNAACFAALGLPAGATYMARDLWAHANISGVVDPTKGFDALVLGGGGSALFRLFPRTK